MNSVEKWGVFELSLKGKTQGNPFTEYAVRATFSCPQECVTVDGFYDGDGTYRARFMPSFEGEYRYRVEGSFSDEVTEGGFSCVAPRAGNHGPVRVNGFHFAYEDATPYFPVGTTCYVWTHQNDVLYDTTLKTLSGGYFNKIRFCIFPKHYLYNLHEPQTYPYEGTPCSVEGFDPKTLIGEKVELPGNHWDFARFNPDHFRRIERAICDLMQMGIEADLIVMHPYDRWGFSHMTAEQDDLYWNYVVARFAAYRNVWWSLANEYDLMYSKTLADWERYAAILVRKDPYRRLRSIHNCRAHYDYSRPWVTHCCIQRQDNYKCAELTDEYRTRYGKPVILDEIAYEGNIERGWGNISGRELVRRFWEATARGGYAGHGETYVHPKGILWWSHGGELHGESHERLKFLRGILSETPGAGLRQTDISSDDVSAMVDAARDPGYYLVYYGFNRPSSRQFHLDDEHDYRVEIIDTWNMTIEDAGVHRGHFTIPLPGREYMAIRLRRT